MRTRQQRYKDAARGISGINNLIIRHVESEHKRKEIFDIQPGMSYQQARQYFNKEAEPLFPPKEQNHFDTY